MDAEGQKTGRPELIRARRRKGLTQEAAAEVLGVSLTTWARWERGEQGVRARHRARLAKVFDAASDDVDRWVDGWTLPETPSWPIADCGDGSVAATVKSANSLWRFEMDPSRRHMLATLPFVPAVLGEWLASWRYDSPAASAAHNGSGRAVGMADVERINQAQQAFRQMDHQFGAGLVRPAVLRYLDSNITPLLNGRYDDKVGAALMSAAAGMSWMAGWTAFDMTRHGTAQQHFGQALGFAKAGNDPLTGAGVLGALTQQAFHLDRGDWAMRLARAATDTATRADAPPRVMAMVLVKEAWATAFRFNPAESGDRHAAKQVERLLADAERMHARGATDRDPAWSVWYEEMELRAEAGNCWRLIGDHQRALATAEAAVTEFQGRLPRSAQINRVHAAEAHVKLGDVEQALEAARPAILATKALASPRTVGFLKGFDKHLDPYADTIAVREFRDHLRRELAA